MSKEGLARKHYPFRKAVTASHDRTEYTAMIGHLIEICSHEFIDWATVTNQTHQPWKPLKEKRNARWGTVQSEEVVGLYLAKSLPNLKANYGVWIHDHHFPAEC